MLFPSSKVTFDLLKTGAFTTFTLQVYFFVPLFQVILVFPVFFAVTTPFFVTDATFLFAVVYFPPASFAPTISKSILSPRDKTQLDTDSFTFAAFAACAGSGTAVTAIAAAAATAILLHNFFLMESSSFRLSDN